MTLREYIEDKKTKFNEALGKAPDKWVASRIIRDREKWLCRNDLWHLCCKTGHLEIEKYKEFYQPLCDLVSQMNWVIVKRGLQQPSYNMVPVETALSNDTNKRLFLWFRTAFKTTIIVKVHTLQLLLNFPDIRIAIVHNKQENASDLLVNVRSFFYLDYLRDLFGDFIPAGKDWGNMSGFTVATRKDLTKNEDSVEAIGVDTEVTGRHYDVFKKDDLVTEKSVNTEEQVKKSIQWNELSKSLFDNPTIAIEDFSGTRYHFSDLYSRLLEDNKIYHSIIRFDDPLVEQHLLGTRFSKEGVEDLKKNGWVWSCQYLLKPEDPSQRRFTDEMIKYYHTLPRHLNYYLLVDPASARKKKSDWTVMSVVGIDHRNDRYIVDIMRDRIDPKQRVDEAFKLIEKYQVKAVAWETIGFQETDAYYLKERRRNSKISFALVEINSHSASKKDRIQSLIPEYLNHRWFWAPKGVLVRYVRCVGVNIDMIEELEYEFFQFPLGIHDDILDSLTFIHKVSVQVPAGAKPSEPPRNSPAGLERRLRDEEIEKNNQLPRRYRKEISELSLS